MASKHKLRRADTRQLAEMDLDQLLALLSPEELEELENMVDPDDSLIPPDQRCRDQTKKAPTGPLNRKKLLAYLEKMAKEEEDWPEEQPYQPGVKRGKVWVPKEEKIKTQEEKDLEYELDLGDEYESALSGATEAELVDLAAILGLHSMLNQDQYYASLLNKGQKLGDKFESTVRASQPKLLPLEPDNSTDVDKTIEQVVQNDSSLKVLNWNNIKNISKEKFQKLFKGLAKNTHLKSLSVANTDLTDSSAELLVEALKENTTLMILNVESNYISNIMVKNILEAINKNQSVIEFRAANQGCSVLGNKIEMEIAELIENNKTMLRLGLHFEITNACMRVAEQLQTNYDKVRVKRVGDK